MRPKHAAARRNRPAVAATRHSVAARHGVPPVLAEDGLLVMDASLNPIAADRGAAAILGVANQDSSSRALHLPPELQEHLKDHQTNGLPANLQFRAGNAGYSCRAFIMNPQNAETGQTLVALHFQKDTSISNSIARVAAHYHLTEREQQALEGIAAGLTSKEIALGMNISPNTVKSFLRIIMLKMDVATRVGLVGKLLEYRDNHTDESPS
jgi:DNA-binding CsgD family transcriptional regulator